MGEAYAQDIHFSQFNQTPSLINPALTGSSSVLRASLINRDQWRSVTVPYKTFGAFIEMKFKPTNWTDVDPHLTRTFKKTFSRIACGLSFFSDKAGDGNMGISQVNLSFASFVPISRNNSLSLGLQASIVQRTLDFSKLIFPVQYNGSGYDPNISNRENAALQNYIYPDFACGVNWSYGYSQKAIAANDEFKSNVGVSIYHINRPKQNFLIGSDERLSMKYNLHCDFLIGIKNTNIGLAPTCLVAIQKTSLEILGGTLIKYYFHEESKYTGTIKRSSFGLGAFYRNKDAVILSTLIEYKQYAIGFSYDINTSKLSIASSGKGGPEVFIRFSSANPFLYQMKTKSRYKLN